MIHDSERESANFNYDVGIRLCKKIANEDVREQTNPHQTHRYYSTPDQMKPGSPILTGEYQESSAHQHLPQELAERAAIILALKVASSKRHNQS
jgi:hypothetical protein